MFVSPLPPAPANEIRLRRSNNNIIPKARMRTLKMSIVIVSSFIVCWTPYYLLGLWYWFSPEGLKEAVSDSFTHLLFLFGLFNACLDPLIYGQGICTEVVHRRSALTIYSPHDFVLLSLLLTSS